MVGTNYYEATDGVGFPLYALLELAEYPRRVKKLSLTPFFAL